MLDLGTLEKGKLARLRGSAERAAAGDSLVSWAGPLPEEFTEPMAALYNAMSDAPREAGVAPEVWDAGRIRDRDDACAPGTGGATTRWRPGMTIRASWRD